MTINWTARFHNIAWAVYLNGEFYQWAEDEADAQHFCDFYNRSMNSTAVPVEDDRKKRRAEMDKDFPFTKGIN